MEDNWRDNAKYPTMVSRLKEAKRRGLFTDVTFHVGPEDKFTTFKVHRLILACGSSVFENMLYGSSYKGPDDPIKITDIPADAFSCLIDYLYDLNVDFLDITIARETFLAASKYRVGELMFSSVKFMTRVVTDKTVLPTLKLAVEYKLIDLKNQCIRTMLPSVDEVLQSSKFPKSSLDVVETVLDMCWFESDRIQCLCLLAIGRWWKKHSKCTQDILYRLLSFVDFKRLSVAEFNEFSNRYPEILPFQERLAIVKYLLSPDKNCLPEWCKPSKPAESVSPKFNFSSDDSDEDHFDESESLNTTIKRSSKVCAMEDKFASEKVVFLNAIESFE